MTSLGLPTVFIGAWERHDLCVDGDIVTDAGRAVWIQTSAEFVDVRGAGGFASNTSFAGTTSWSDPFLTWTHTIDRATDDVHADRGHICFDVDDALIEEGDAIAGRALPYRERWHRLDGTAEPCVVEAKSNSIGVRVGNHAAAVRDARGSGGGFGACYWRLVDGVWVTEIAIGDHTRLAPPE
jgi:hypothetical protein